MATTLDNLKTMRDINDYCVANKIPSLAQGMIELPPPESLRRLAAETVMEETIHTYRARVGEESFLQAIKQFLQNEYSTSIETNNILATHGVSGGIVSTLALVQESGGTRVGLIEPFYTYHIFQIERLFGKQTPIEYIPLGGSETGFAPNWDLIEQALGPKGADNHLDILLVCNPSNPAGKVWLKEEMDRLVTLTKERGTRLLVDECYSDMVWEPHVHYSPIQDELHDHVVVVRGFSKVLGCQSWRVGFAISSSETIAQLMRVQDPIYICVPWLQIPLGKYLLDKDGFSDHKRKISELIRENWKVLSGALKNKFGWEPLETNGSMYGMLKHNEATDMDAVKLGLASGVGVCPGSMFFANFPVQTGYVRIHCGVSAEKAALIVSNLA